MRSSDLRASLPLACALVLVPLQLGCIEPEPTGDLLRFGCPEGEVCTPGALALTRGAAYRCGGIVALEAAPSLASTAVALGGRTTAAAEWAGWGASGSPTGAFTSEFEWSYELRGSSWLYTARAIAVGVGRFEGRSGGSLSGPIVDYVRMPVLEADHAIVSDGVACPEEARVLLRGATVSLQPVVLARDGTPLVDLDATLRTLSGETSVTPSARSERITFRMRYGGDHESLETLSVVDVVDTIRVVERPLDRIRRAPLALTDVVTRVCFRAFSGEATVLGLEVAAARASDERLEATPEGACVLAFNAAFVEDAPEFDAIITVEMAGHSVDVPVRALAPASPF